jgi:flagellar export protein FliJ
MTTFAFRLERVLRWRQAQLELEQFALARLTAECARWDALLARLDSARDEANSLMRSSGPVSGAELGALARHQDHLGQQRKAALERRRECEKRTEQQRARLLKARREHRLLEKLRQARRAEWEAAVDREFEALAAEAYLAQWSPRPRQNPEP